MAVNNDISQSPEQPQFQLGATSSDAQMHAQLVGSHLQGPGAIVSRLGQQFQLPRAQPDSQMSQRPGTNLGES
jgi:hypothetical protein